MDFLDRTLENFREYLKENTDSKNTVKNYVSDLRIFLIFLDSRHSPITVENFPQFLNNQTLSDFSSYLSVINPPATLNRRVSSVKKFFDYYLEHHPLPQTTPTPPPISFSSPVTSNPPAEIIDIPKENTVPTQDTPEPPTTQSIPTAVLEPDNNSNLLRLLPEEVINSSTTTLDGHRNNSSPSSFFHTFRIQIICTVSFLVGFFSTMAVYPLLYP